MSKRATARPLFLMPRASAFILAIVACGQTCQSAFAKSDDPVVLARNGHWNVNYDQDSCSLLASFGSGRDEAVLAFSRFEPGNFVKLMIVGDAFSPRVQTGQLTIDFGPARNPHRVVTTNGWFGDKRFAMVAQPLRFDDREIAESPVPVPSPPLTIEAETAVETLDVGAPGKTYRFMLGPMGRTMAAMRQCTDTLVKSWGLDPAIQATRRLPPVAIGNPTRWITSSDYPDTALLRGRGSVIQFRLMVDETGKVTGCHLQRATAETEFQRITCERITARARFRPALDAAGRPVASYFVSSVRFIVGPM